MFKMKKLFQLILNFAVEFSENKFGKDSINLLHFNVAEEQYRTKSYPCGYKEAYY